MGSDWGFYEVEKEGTLIFCDIQGWTLPSLAALLPGKTSKSFLESVGLCQRSEVSHRIKGLCQKAEGSHQIKDTRAASAEVGNLTWTLG